MKNTIVLGIGLVFAFGAAAQQAPTMQGMFWGGQGTVLVKQKLSGSTVNVSRPNTETESHRAVGFCAGTGTFGPHTCETLAIVPPSVGTPVGEYVGNNTDNCPNRVEFTFPGPGAHVQRYWSGELLYWKKDQSPGAQNYMCADPLNPNQFNIVQTYDYVGGTGRFQGATGTVEMDVTFDRLEIDAEGESAMYGSHATVAGTIHLVRGGSNNH